LEGNFAVRLVLLASVSPTEGGGKVLTAASNVLGDCQYTTEDKGDEIILRSSEVSCLWRIRDQLRDRHVRDAARRLLYKSKDGDKMTLMFNRQAAYVGVIAVVASAEESPLGPLTLHIECDKADELMDWLTVPRPEEPQGQVRRGQPRSS
jgi:predicted RNA binding protein with dsRBD fold (UPF0201 family)